MMKLIFLLLPLLASTALAQEEVEEEPQPDIRRYTVEMIIFAYAQNVSAGSEIFIPDLPPVEEQLLPAGMPDSVPEELREEQADDQLFDELADEEEDKYALTMLDEEEFAMLETYEQLQILDAYEPLVHFGWTQPTYPDEEVETRPLSFFVTPPDGLDGNLTLYLSRYLHLAVNLQLNADALEPANRAENDQGEGELPILGNFDEDEYDFGDFNDFEEEAAVVYPVHYRIEEDRIFRNGELRYFDHPKFGVLARITRVEEEEVEELEQPLDDETELLSNEVE